MLKKLAHIRNFGFDGPERFELVGVNGKNSEFHAAMGIANIKYMSDILEKRKSGYLHYKEALKDAGVQFQKIERDTIYNHSYFPIVLESEKLLKKIEKYFNDNLIYPRRYFYPSLNNTSLVKYNACPISEDIASRILCLPLFHQLSTEEMNFILRIYLRAINY
jgi:dTDP-4-amino-4,6-dideoxygalactose transaminase